MQCPMCGVNPCVCEEKINMSEDRSIPCIGFTPKPAASTKKFKVLVVDQFSGLTLHRVLLNAGSSFEALCTHMLEADAKTQVLEVDESYTPPFATTTFRAAEDGTAEVWKYRWDSSG